VAYFGPSTQQSPKDSDKNYQKPLNSG